MTLKEYNDCVRLYSDDLYRFALRYTGDIMSSEDAVQDSFLQLWERHSELDATRVKGYLLKGLYRRLVDAHRRELVDRKARAEMAHGQQSYEQHHTFELRDTMQQALSRLPEQQRMLILLRDIEGYTYSEMATLCNLDEQQVGVYLFRARKALKNLLQYELGKDIKDEN